jgi:integral membrane protein (TIGR01906 family)
VALTALVLIGASFKLILLPPVTSAIANNTVNDRLSPLRHDELVAVAETGRAYVAGERGAVLPEGDDERTAFPADVVSHMEDVRLVIQAAHVLTLVLAALLVAVMVVAGRRAGRSTVAAGLFAGGITAVALALLLVVVGVLNFDALFTGMHKLFFADGTWTFAEDSLLICAYPLPFWTGMAIVWALALAFLSAASATVGFLLRSRPA